MHRRFYVENEIKSEQLTIDGPDAHHIGVVNRLVPGDDILLFDGSGKEFVAKIVEIKKKSVQVEIVQADEVSRELPHAITLAVALPKGDRQKVLVEKLVELGVATLIPINCERSVAVANDKAVGRLNRRVIEASKQCGRNILMTIEKPISFSELVKRNDFEHRLLAHPYESRPAHSIHVTRTDPNTPSRIIAAVGPEGGFSDAEVDLAMNQNWTTISLTPAILRVETAAVAAAVLFGCSGMCDQNGCG